MHDGQALVPVAYEQVDGLEQSLVMARLRTGLGRFVPSRPLAAGSQQ